MASGLHGQSLEEAAEAVAAYLPHRTKPRSPEGLKKNLRLRDGRWFWHWDPAFLTKPLDDSFVREEKLERAAIDLEILILLIRGRLSDVVSEEACEALPRNSALTPSSSSCPMQGTPPRVTTTTRSVKSWSSSSTGEPLRRTVGFNFSKNLELPGPQVTEAQAEQIVARYYGMTARAKLLGSNQDCNFTISDANDDIVGILKIANPAFNATELEAQDAAADLIADAEPSLRIAVPLPNDSGDKCTAITGLLDKTAYVRLLRVPAWRHFV